jgi:glycosyltransferase involved in cell wall biosynthesis
LKQGESSAPLRVTFILPLPGWKPAGGFKVIYEYANYLASQGDIVQIVHTNLSDMHTPLLSLGTKDMARLALRYLRLKVTGEYRPDKWFKIDPAVKILWVPSLKANNIPDGDVIITSAWQTAEWAMTYPSSKGRCFYLIQHLETWAGPKHRVLNTWTIPLEKIVIAPWLQRLAAQRGESSCLIANGLDFSHFQQLIPPEKRDPNELLMLHHCVDWKGTEDGLAAFAIARETIPELRLTLFGINPFPGTLPPGVRFYHQPTQRHLLDMYNQAAVFISPSWTEGWALPPAEALMCGCALAVTDIGGHEAYARHEETALLSPIKDPEALASNIVRLVLEESLRVRISRHGHRLIRQFTWERAGCSLRELITTDPNVVRVRESA